MKLKYEKVIKELSQSKKDEIDLELNLLREELQILKKENNDLSKNL
jgi:hypothetical protein